MKTKKLLSVLLAVFMLCTSFTYAVFAKQNIDTGLIDFEDYKGTWDAGSKPDEATLPTYSGVSFAKGGNTAPNASNGVTSGTPSGDSTNGNSMKVYYAYNEAYTASYSGFQAYLENDFENTFRVEFSLYYDQSLGGDYLYFKDSSNTSRAFYITSGRKVNVFQTGYIKNSEGTDLVLALDTWYDFDVIYNTNNQQFFVEISDSTGVVANQSGVSADKNLDMLSRIDFRSYAALGNSNNNKNTGIAEIYFDNLRIYSDWKYEIPSASADDIDSFNFTGYSAGSALAGEHGSFAFPADSKNITLATASDSQKGTSLSYTLTSASQTAELRYNVTSREARGYVYNVSFMLKDTNFAEMRLRHYYGSSATSFKYNNSAYMMYFTKSSVSILGHIVKKEDGKTNYTFDTDVWYNYSMTFDSNTGSMTITISDDSGIIYTATERDSAFVGVEYSRTSIANNGALNKTATGDSSTILFDDISVGYTDSLMSKAFQEYDAFDVAAGATSTITAPFANTKFYVSADITTKDDATTTVVATGASEDIILATVGGSAATHQVRALAEDVSSTAINFNAGGDIIVSNLKIEAVYDLDIIESRSTTGEGIKLGEADVVKAVFTNKLDQSTFTASTVTMPYNSDVEYEIAFPDDYSAEIRFDKEPGTHYHIAFNEVYDIYGNSLTDYIEFDTVAPDLYMTDVQFLRDGSVLSLTSPGKVTASFEAKANNGKSYDMMFALGLYKGAELAYVISDSFTVANAKETHSLSLTIPDDGNYYVAKAFLWDDKNLEPFIEEKSIKPTTNLPVVILRFDDLKSQKIDDFDEVTEMLDECDIKASYGFMGYQILNNVSSTIRDEFDAKIIAMKNNPRIELWHHGYADTNMYEGKTEEEQRSDFAQCIDGAYEKYGIVFNAFCPPSGKFDATTIRLMNEEFTNFKVFMTKNTPEDIGYEGDYGFTVLNNYVTIETSDTILPLETLKANWQAAIDAGHDYVIMYSHPGYSWNKLTTGSETEYGKETLKQFVEYLKSEGAIFMNPTEYAEYVEAIN